MSFWDNLHTIVGGNSPSPLPPTPQPPHLYAAPGPPGPPYAYLLPNPVAGSHPPPAPSGNSGAAAEAATENQLRLQADQSVLQDLDGQFATLTASVQAAQIATTNELKAPKPKYDAAWNNVKKKRSVADLIVHLQQLGNVIAQLQQIWADQHDYSVQAHDAAVRLVNQYGGIGQGTPSPPQALAPLLKDPRFDPRGGLLERIRHAARGAARAALTQCGGPDAQPHARR